MSGTLARTLVAPVLGVVVSMGVAPAALAQLRIVTYNTNTFGTEAPGSNIRTVRPGADIVFEAIGEELVNGIARPADIVLLQEQQQPDTTTQDLVNRLNAIYAGTGITYARGFEIGNTTFTNGMGTPNSSEIRQSVVYRTDTVQLISEDSFGNISGPTQPRETLLHRFRPIGYGAEADLYIFNSHLEAGDNLGFGDDLFARESEATDIRNYITSNGLGSSNLIHAGDFNTDSNFETSGVTNFGGQSALEILAAGTDADGRLLDPLFPNGEAVNFQIYNSGVPDTQFGVDLAPVLTQSPSGGAGALAGGGIDDRFDFILQSDELLDGEGVASIPNSLRAFGNNGSTPNRRINSGNTIQIAGLSSFTTAQVLDALESASDHLPVVEDFQLPAVLEAIAGTVPATLDVGEDFDLSVAIRNAADVSVVLGADELDYVFSTAGDLIGAGGGSDAALGAGVLEFVGLDTSTPGSKSGVITVTATSEAAANAEVMIPISFEVLAAVLLGDYNASGQVEQGDLDLVLQNWGVDTDAAGVPAGWVNDLPTGQIEQTELDGVLQNWGNTASPGVGGVVVPEPASLGVLILGVASARIRPKMRPGVN